MNFGIAGIGVVGSALQRFLETKGHLVHTYDKKLKESKISNLLKSQLCFLCLPTEYDDETQEYNMKPIRSVLKYLSKKHYLHPVVIKSTMTPGTTLNLKADFPNLHIVHCPEFLSSATNDTDTQFPNQILLGCPQHTAAAVSGTVYTIFKELYPNIPIFIVDSQTTECVKLFCNSFYSVKLQYFNDMYAICQREGYNYDLIKQLMLMNGWIHPMHTVVPGYDGNLGFGGKCLPKDILALKGWCKKKNHRCKLIEATILSNINKSN
jgi:UDPglucose 6-dehydrogenase